ncbi:hypothetical protein [Flavobacterium ginsengiterrae]|uniref:DUF4405 domain-containing protein n=1 Tax=Flavobacterium ginsengiterrae TaxID=871695 RepID=A0ABP7GN88_9FLAO
MSTTKIHYISGITITIFIVLHLFNHICSLFGEDLHISVMESLRIFYRNIFIETIVISAVFIQIISGLTLFKKKRKGVISGFEKIHIWSGLYLALFLIIHLSAILSGRFILHLNTNFYFGTAGLNTFPFNIFFIPYYGLAIISFFGHIAGVHYKKMKRKILHLTPNQQSKIILFCGLSFTLLIILGLTNYFHGVRIPAEYNVLIGK